jgi:immunity protein Imm1 of predicted polymorphic toxin system
VTMRVVYDMCEDELPDAAAVEEFFAERSTAIAPHGGRANAYWFAPVGADDELRLDIDFDAGRAALRWLPDQTHAVELNPTEPIVVLESSDHDLVTIPAALARVSVDTARRAVSEYVRTGQRPNCAHWIAK